MFRSKPRLGRPAPLWKAEPSSHVGGGEWSPPLRRLRNELALITTASAQMLGLNGIRVDDPDQLGNAWEQALAADRPTVPEVIANADIPPIPPHIDFPQTKSFTNAVLHGDPDSLGMIKQGIKGKLAEYTK